MNLTTFDQLESRVRHYVHSFPTIFSRARGAQLWDENDRCYIDFFSGAGALNYGHNNYLLREKLLEYIESDGVVHSLDMATSAKGHFLQTFESVVLKPRNMKYVMQFTGPTGANAVEAALKLARKIKKRSNVIAFTNGFHGVSMGALATTANAHFRGAAGINLGNVTFMPYDGYFGPGINTIDYLARMIDDRGSGVDAPAAVIVETTQGEGGVRVASSTWLRELEKCCRRHDMLLIVDEIQVGCGRTGHFFSFEEAGIKPDIITMSKSLSGYGLPMAMVLMKPELDQWEPSEHNGTFRGNNLAFVTAAQALQCYWKNDELAESVRKKGELIRDWFEQMASNHPEVGMRFRGRGLICGLTIADGHSVTLKRMRNRSENNIHRRIVRNAFENGLIIETTGAYDDVLKMLPPLVIEEGLLRKGLEILENSIAQSLEQALGSREEEIPFPELMMHT
jgi:diaminobutyrate-2-oxoglutarate transaminase